MEGGLWRWRNADDGDGPFFDSSFTNWADSGSTARARWNRASLVRAADGGDDAERKTSAPAKMKSRKDSLAGLTKEERLAK